MPRNSNKTTGTNGLKPNKKEFSGLKIKRPKNISKNFPFNKSRKITPHELQKAKSAIEKVTRKKRKERSSKLGNDAQKLTKKL